MGDLTKTYGGFDQDGRPHYLIEYYLYPFQFEDRIEVMIWEEEGNLCYGKYYYKGIDDGSIDGDLEMSIDEFYRIIEKIGIQEWDDHFEPVDCVIEDGESWEVTYESPEGRIYKKGGSNAYPKKWRSFIKALEMVVGKI